MQQPARAVLEVASQGEHLSFIQACGYTGTTLSFEGTTYTLTGVHYGHNTPLAPSSGRILRAGSQATDQALTSSDIFTLELVDYAKEMATVANPKIRPVRIKGANHYVMYLHPYQVTDLRTNTSTGQWLDIQKAAASRGGDNPIFSGAIGMYNNVIIRESEHVTTGVHSTTSAAEANVRRAVFLGAQSCVTAFGMGRSVMKYKMIEELFDYQDELGVSCKTILGMKKTVFNSEDFGTIVVPTYAAAHT